MGGDVLAVAVGAVLIAFAVFVVRRLWRSWKDAGTRWGGGSPKFPRVGEPDELGEDVRQADRLREDRADRDRPD